MQIKFNSRPLERAFKEAQMSFAELAYKSDYSETWVRKLLSGDQKTASRRAIEAVSKVLKVAADSVLVK